MQAARFWVSGRVQGVGFRYSARRRAIELGLSGYARNLVDGRVELLAQGEDSSIDAFEEWLQRGPPIARVDRVQREPADIAEMNGFN
jgi:acylphosphatase